MRFYIIFFFLFLQFLFAESALELSVSLSFEQKNNPTNPLPYETLKNSLPHLKSKVFEEALHELLMMWNQQDGIIIDSKKTLFKGKSQDRVYFVLDQKGNLSCVIKAFRSLFQPKDKFLRELIALVFLEQSNLPHVGSIAPLGVAQGFFDDSDWIFLLETVAPGVRLDQFIYHIFYKKCSYEEALASYRTFGSSLAEFHRPNFNQLSCISSKTTLEFLNILTEVLKHPQVTQDLSQRTDLIQFEKVIKKILNVASKIPIPLSYAHGDAHMGNIFFDPQSCKMTFVDVALMSYSFSNDFAPVGEGLADLYRVDEHFRRKADGFLAKEQIEEISFAILDAYAKESGFSPPADIECFYRVYYKLRRLLSFSNYIQEADLERRLRRQITYEKTLDYFASLVLASSSERMD